MYLAHISDDKCREQSLMDHLTGTAELAGEFAGRFGASSWGYWCGMYHDIGKGSKEFQHRLHGGPRVDHATAGAIELYHRKMFAPAYCVAGHHSGLPDGGTSVDEETSTLWGRLKKKVPDYHGFQKEVPEPAFERPSIVPLGNGGFSMAFFIRMVYSCLVDADFLDTEAFMKDGIVQRPRCDSMEVLHSRLMSYVGTWLGHNDLSTVNGRRSEILRNCLEAADQPEGLFSLTVPTGAGKTISSLAFALKHALTYQKQRVIYIIPYTSIIEQTAEIFSGILGRENVLEHHCNVEFGSQEEFEKKQLAAENWDMPVIVTTNVQFFESLYSNKSSKCRKLHRIAGSVLIFDEAQMLPVDYLQPCVRAIAELVKNYGCTAVLCTATQPSLGRLFPKGIICREICRNVEEQYGFFRRAVIENLGRISEDELVAELQGKPQVLCILNSRKRVQRVYQALGGEGCFHLSTLMYPVHRKRVLNAIRDRLSSGEVCQVTATSLVEAGVDLDFPYVYRELAGLDSMIQAAGRCNREGKRKLEESRAYIFDFDHYDDAGLPPALKQQIAVAGQILREYADISALDAIRDYFDRLHDIKGEALDKKGIVEAFDDPHTRHTLSFPFATVAGEFHLIENQTKMIVIDREEDAQQLVRRFRTGERSRDLMRRIGNYSVNIYQNDFLDLDAAGLLECLDDGIYLLRDSKQYSEETGLKLDVQRGDALFM